MNSDNWASVSKEAKVLVKKLTRVDPAKRLTVEQALKDPWFNGICGVEDAILEHSGAGDEPSPNLETAI